MKILILSNLTSYTYNFRFEILKAMIKSGHDVTVVCDNDDGTKQTELENLGCRMIILPFNGKGTNISEEYRLLRSYMSIVREIRPDIIMLGFDQTFDEKQLEADLKKHGFDTKVMRATECSDDLNGTRRIIKKILEMKGEIQ